MGSETFKIMEDPCTSRLYVLTERPFSDGVMWEVRCTATYERLDFYNSKEEAVAVIKTELTNSKMKQLERVLKEAIGIQEELKELSILETEEFVEKYAAK